MMLSCVIMCCFDFGGWRCDCGSLPSGGARGRSRSADIMRGSVRAERNRCVKERKILR